MAFARALTMLEKNSRAAGDTEAAEAAERAIVARKREQLRALMIVPHSFLNRDESRPEDRAYCFHCDGHRLFIAHEPALRRENG